MHGKLTQTAEEFGYENEGKSQWPFIPLYGLKTRA
jgi:hypothetical protein